MPGFDAILIRLSRHDPRMRARFFLSKSKALGDARPLDLLRQGKVEPVLVAATEYGEHGAA